MAYIDSRLSLFQAAESEARAYEAQLSPNHNRNGHVGLTRARCTPLRLALHVQNMGPTDHIVWDTISFLCKQWQTVVNFLKTPIVCPWKRLKKGCSRIMLARLLVLRLGLDIDSSPFNIWEGLGLLGRKPKARPGLSDRHCLSKEGYFFVKEKSWTHILLLTNKHTDQVSYKLGHWTFPFSL